MVNDPMCDLYNKMSRNVRKPTMWILTRSGINKNITMSSFKSSRNIQKKECGPDRSVSDNQSSSVTLNELAEKAIIIYCNFCGFY